MNTNDDALLDALAVALAPALLAPSVDDVDAVRALVARRGDDDGDGRDGRDDDVVALVPVHAAPHPVRRMFAVAAAVVALVVTVGAVALATGSRLPRELRAPARALGLSVDSAALADARSAMSDLRDALRHTDHARIAASRDALAARLRRLGPDDRATVAKEATALLAIADDRLQEAEIGDATGTSRPTPSTTAGPEIEGPATDAPAGAGSGAGPVPTSRQPGAAVPSTKATTEPRERETEMPGT